MRGRRLIGSTALLRITSLNLNGIRSAFRKGLQPWMEKHGADILCLQEIKIADADLTDDLRHPPGYTGHFHHAEKKGYSGVGLYLRNAAQRVNIGLDCEVRSRGPHHPRRLERPVGHQRLPAVRFQRR